MKNGSIKRLAMFTCLFLLTGIMSPAKSSAEEKVTAMIDSYVEAYMEEHQVPGVSIAIVKENGDIYTKGWGVTGQSEEQVTPHTPFLLGSISKSLTALAIMKLIEDNVVNLEDRVVDHVSWFTLKDKQALSRITVEQLLSHTSGISTYTGLQLADRGAADLDAIEQNVRELKNIGLTASPGESYQYSDANYLVLGAIIEEVYNQPFSEYMNDYIFAELGMKDAAADRNAISENGYLAGYQSWFGMPKKSSVPYDNGGAPYGYIAASAQDMARYVQFLMGDQDNSFLTKESLKQFLSPLTQSRADRYYGFGLMLTESDINGKMVWHAGSTPDSRSEFFLLPDKGWGGAILTNKNHILEESTLTGLRDGIIDILNGQEPIIVEKPIPLLQLVVLGAAVLLVFLFVYLLVNTKKRNIKKKKSWQAIGSLLIIIAIASMPTLIYIAGSPWHSIKLFAPDIALLAVMIAILLALNGLMVIYMSANRKGKQLITKYRKL